MSWSQRVLGIPKFALVALLVGASIFLIAGLVAGKPYAPLVYLPIGYLSMRLYGWVNGWPNR